MTTVLAVYEGGLLRPKQPLPFGEGETVEITVNKPKPSSSVLAQDEITRRLKTAKTIEEWIAATELLPPDDGGYDIVQALKQNRIWSGEMPMDPVGRGIP